MNIVSYCIVWPWLWARSTAFGDFKFELSEIGENDCAKKHWNQ